jgi:hypothetical protein
MLMYAPQTSAMIFTIDGDGGAGALGSSVSVVDGLARA